MGNVGNIHGRDSFALLVPVSLVRVKGLYRASLSILGHVLYIRKGVEDRKGLDRRYSLNFLFQETTHSTLEKNLVDGSIQRHFIQILAT